MTNDEIDGLVHRVRELAVAARSATGQWVVAVCDDETGIGGPPDDERPVLAFLNGHADSSDLERRAGGGWGIRLGWFDHDKGRWRVGGSLGERVTHWMDLPPAPARVEGT